MEIKIITLVITGYFDRAPWIYAITHHSWIPRRLIPTKGVTVTFTSLVYVEFVTLNHSAVIQ